MQTRLPFKFLDFENNYITLELVLTCNVKLYTSGGGTTYAFMERVRKEHCVSVPKILIKNYRNTRSLFEIPE